MSGLILPGQGPRRISEVQTSQDQTAAAGQNQVSRTLDLYDSEIAEIEKVLNKIQEKRGHKQHLDLGQFDLFIREEFHKIGFEVDVKWWHTDVPGVKRPDIEILGRTDSRFEFDRDRQVHEVTNDLLGLNEGGVIKNTKEDLAALEGQVKQHGHHH